MAISIQNIYYLLCYAWDRLEERQFVDVHSVPGNRVENLLGIALRDNVARLIRRGLDREYRTFEEEGRRPRGKILTSQTARRMLLPRGRVAYEADDLSHDVAHNQVIKAAMSELVSVRTLDAGIRENLLNHRRWLSEVTDCDLAPALFRKVQLHRNLASYTFAINICRLVGASLLPEPGTGRKRFHPFTADEREMGHLFQAFVRNFLRREQDSFRVSADKVPWNLVSGADSWLPEMQTDITLKNDAARIVIEVKYYANPYQTRFRGKKLHSSHLYQLLTYLSQLSATPGPRPLGVLLYAGPLDAQDLVYRIGSHTFLVRSVDLSAEWRSVHRQVMALADELDARARQAASSQSDLIHAVAPGSPL